MRKRNLVKTATTTHPLTGQLATRTTMNTPTHAVWAMEPEAKRSAYFQGIADHNLAEANKVQERMDSGMPMKSWGGKVWDTAERKEQYLDAARTYAAMAVAPGDGCWQVQHWCGRHDLAMTAARRLAKLGYEVTISEVR